jgi:large subunit ribosomal protein L24
MKIKKGDKVIVIAGKYKGALGTVSEAFPAKERVLVDGVNVQTKHEKERGTRKGQIVKRPAPLHVSNVMIVDPKTGKGSRIGFKRVDGKRIRVSKKSNSEI